MLHPVWGVGPVGAWGAHHRCRQARDSSGLAGCQALGLAQTIAAPTRGSPGPRDPPSSRSAHAVAHRWLRQGNTCARRSRAPGPGGGGGATSSCCLATGQQPPLLQIPEVGAFPKLAAASSCAELCAPCQGCPCPPLPRYAPPRAHEVGAAQPDAAEPCWVPAATTTLSPPSPWVWEQLWGAGRAFWGASLGGAQGQGMRSKTVSNVSCFPWLGASHL